VHLARGVLDGGGEPAVEPTALQLLDGELLPDWYDDWVLVERERLRQLRLHALERLAEQFASAHRYHDAIDAALAALRADPLRESVHRLLIRTYLAEGNAVEAVRQYRLYRALIQEKLGLEPSSQIRELVNGSGLLGDAPVTRR
jgi:DNA-binding SARP family transcriptional activator